MKKTALTILGALLIAGSAVQVAMASENHVKKVRRATIVQDQWNFREAYDGPYYYYYNPTGYYYNPYGYYYNYIPWGQQVARERNRQNFGFSGWDPSRPGDWDPSLRPAD